MPRFKMSQPLSSQPIADAAPLSVEPFSSPSRRQGQATEHSSAAQLPARSAANKTAPSRAFSQTGKYRRHPTKRSSPGRLNTRHSAYSLRGATIAYPWHPLFGRTLQVAPFRRGKDLKCIYTEERRGFSREVPNWMFDESYCAGMALGPPQVSIDGLNELAVVLKLLGTNQASGARSRPSMKREKGRAEKKPISRANAIGSGSGSSDSPEPTGRQSQRSDPGARRSLAGSGGRRDRSDVGR